MFLTLNDTKTRLHAHFDYSQAAVSKMHLIPGSRWSGLYRCWEMPKDMETLTQFKTLFPWAQVNSIVREWENKFNQKKNLNLEHKKHPYFLQHEWDNMQYKLKPFQHQLKALDLLFENKHYALAAEMGTGKSGVIVNLLRRLKYDEEERPALIVCPLSVVGVWRSEIEKHSWELSSTKLVGSVYERKKALGEKADVYIINYEGARILERELKERQWSMVVCDESQKIKNRTAKQSKVCVALGKNAERRYILTGSMITNNPLDAFGQFKFLSEEILGSNYFGFQNRYAIMVTNGRARFPVRFVNLEELADRIDPWTYRVTKKECLDLPEKIHEVRHVDMSDKAAKVYKTLATELTAFLDSGEVVTASIILTKLLRFSQITAGFVTTEAGDIKEVDNEGKINALMDVVEEAEGQIVVWTKFRHEMAMVARRLDKHGIKFACLDGSTSQADREDILRRFAAGELRVFVGQIQAGGLGINLNTASTCVYMSNPYSLGDKLQSEDRLHRIGQRNNVTYVDLVCPGTIDEKVLEMLSKKKNVADLINKDTDRKAFVRELLGEKSGSEFVKEVTSGK